MTWREVLHRVREQLTLLGLQLQYRLGAATPGDPAAYAFCSASEPQLTAQRFDVTELRKARYSLIDGHIEFYDCIWRWNDSPDVWHRAPDTGRLWPDKFFGSIAYRDGNPVGDVRKLWEIGRLQHLVDLAILIPLVSDEERRQALELVTRQLASWVRLNPPLAGAHYISSMECALRIVAICHALDLLRKDLTEREPWIALARIVESHAPLIEQRLSLHSSAGNHLLSECVGLLYAGALFPEMKGSKRWLSKGLAILESESGRQVLADGGGIEQATGYHRYNLELISLAIDLLVAKGIEVPSEVARAADRGSRFLAAIAPHDQPFPFMGDSDSGHALSRFHLLPDPAGPRLNNVHTFAISGYTVVRAASSHPARLILDHGPLGMPPGFGHGHADALSVVLHVGGCGLFVDPGTYTYTGDQRWRHYFRSTPAHNTVTVDGHDQARQEACFLWSRPYEAHLIASEADGARSGRLLARHSGYSSLGVSHIRGLAWHTDKWILVWDRLEGIGTHSLELHWHLGIAPQWQGANSFRLSVGDQSFVIECSGGTLTAHTGEEDPELGWFSPRYGVRTPITTVRLAHRGKLPHEFSTLVRFPHFGQPPASEVEASLAWMKANSHS